MIFVKRYKDSYGKKYIKKDNIHVEDICKPINTNLKKEYLCYGIYDGIAILLHISKNVKCRTVTIKREDAEYVVNCETTQKLPLNSLESSGIQVSKKQMDKIRTKHQKWKNELAFKKKKMKK